MPQDVQKPSASVPQRRYVDPFTAMRAEMDRVFDSFLGRDLGMSMLSGRRSEEPLAPDVDIREAANEIVIEAELPGIEEKDVSVTLRNGVLTLKGEKRTSREEEKGDFHLSERNYGSFQRVFTIGDGVDPEKVTASFDKGVLKIKLPKKPEIAKAERRIPIGRG